MNLNKKPGEAQFLFHLIATEEKLQLAEEHIESLEQQLAESEKKVTEATQKGI